MANLKQSKLGIVYLLSSSASLAPECEKCCIRNSHQYVGNSLGMIILSLFLSITSTYLMHFYLMHPALPHVSKDVVHMLE